MAPTRQLPLLWQLNVLLRGSVPLKQCGNLSSRRPYQGSRSRWKLHSAARRPLPKFPQHLDWQYRSASTKSYISAGGSTAEGPEWKQWVISELWMASKVIGYGCLIITAFVALTYIGKHAQLEYTSPTPKEYSWRTRAALRAARHAAETQQDYVMAVSLLEEAVNRLGKELKEKGGWDEVSGEWARGYIKTLCQLGDIEEALGKLEEARERWEKVLTIADVHLPVGLKINARLKIGEIYDEESIPGVSGELWEQQMKEKGEKAEKYFREAYSLSLQEVGADPSVASVPGMLPPNIAPTPNMVKAATELAVHYARHKKLDLALPLLLSIYRISIQNAPPVTESKPAAPGETAANGAFDICHTAKILSYIGEILFASGQESEGVSWTRRAAVQATPLAELRATCREAGVHAAQNEVIMLREMIEKRNPKLWVDKLKGKEVERERGKEGRGWALWSKKAVEKERDLEGELRDAEARLANLLDIRVSKET